VWNRNEDKTEGTGGGVRFYNTDGGVGKVGVVGGRGGVGGSSSPVGSTTKGKGVV